MLRKPPNSGGYTHESRKAAEHFISVYEKTDGPIVIPSGSCASMVKNHYPELFKDNSRMLGKAEAIAGRTYELSQFLVHVLKVHESRPAGKRADHVSRFLPTHPELGVRKSRSCSSVPFKVPNLSLCRMRIGAAASEGSSWQDAGSLESSRDEKVESILSTAADTVTGCDHGCLLNISDAMKRRGARVQVKHIAAVLAEALHEHYNRKHTFSRKRAAALRNSTLRAAMQNATRLSPRREPMR